MEYESLYNGFRNVFDDWLEQFALKYKPNTPYSTDEMRKFIIEAIISPEGYNITDREVLAIRNKSLDELLPGIN